MEIGGWGACDLYVYAATIIEKRRVNIIGHLHVSNGILMKRVIARDVMVLECIGVYGNSVLPLFKTCAMRQVYRMC